MNTANAKKEPAQFDSFSDTIFNSLPGNTVVIDNESKIVKVNLNWNNFAIENGMDANFDWTGCDYLEVCKNITGISDKSAAEARKAIKGVFGGEESGFELEYRGQKSSVEKWFRMHAIGFEFEESFFATIIHQDITEAKTQEFALKESEEHFRSLLEQSPLSIQICDKDGGVIDGNKAWRNLWNVSEEDMPYVIANYNILKDEEVAKRGVLPLIKRAFEGETVHLPDFYYESAHAIDTIGLVEEKAKAVWLRITLYPVFDMQGKVKNVVSIEEDISESRQAQIALKESEEKFRELMDQAPYAISLVNLDGRIDQVNQEFMNLWGFSEVAWPVIKENYSLLEDQEAIRLGLMPLIEKAFAGEIVELQTTEYVSKNTTDAIGVETTANKRWVQVRLYPIKNSKGDVVRVVDVAEDVTSRKQVEIALRESEKDFRALVEQNPLYIQTYTPEGSLVSLNKSYSGLLNLSKEMELMLYQNYNVLQDPQAAEQGLGPGLKDVFTGETFHFPEYEFDVERGQKALGMAPKGPSKIWLKTTGFPIKDENDNIKQLVFLSQDVSSRVAAEQSLKEARRFTDKLVQTANVMIVGLDARGNVNLFNPTAERITGYTMAELEGKNWFEFLVPKGRFPMVHKEFDRLLEKGDVNSFQNPILTKNGEERFISWSNSTIKDDEGVQGILSFGQDITERVEADKKVKESEENYRTLIEQANDGIVVLQDAKVKFANSALTRITGYSVEELTGSNFIDFIDEKELDKVKAQYVKRMNGEHVAAYESKIVHKNGSVIDVEFNGRLTQYKGQVADLAMVRDITVRKKAEEEINRLFNLSSDLIVIAGFDGCFKQLNPAWEKTLGYSPDKLMERPFMDFVHYDDHEITKTEMKKLTLGQTTINFENRYMHKDGSVRHISWAATPVVEESIIYCVGRDITESKKIEAALTESEEKFRFLVEQSPFSIQVFNTDGRIEKVNQAFMDLWGITEDTLQGVLDNYNVLEDEEAQKLGVSSAIQSVFRGEKSKLLPLIEYDAEGSLSASGTEIKANKRWVQARLYPVKNSLGKVVNVVDMEEDMTEVIQKEKDILNYQQRLKALTTELTISEEKQRRVIAADLHDHVGQLLASSRLQIAALSDKMEKQDILEKLKNISFGLLQGIQATRSAIFELSPPQLNEIGLIAAVTDWVDQELETKYGLKVNLTGDNRKFACGEDIRILTFRCIRELLMNVVKHADATHADLDIRENIKILIVTLSDDGKGFNYSPDLLRLKGSGFGLFNIQERLEDVGGSIEINSVPGRGTRIKFMVPLNN